MSGKKRIRHSPQQIVGKLQEADRLLNVGQSLGQVLQALSVSEATYHRWRHRHVVRAMRIHDQVGQQTRHRVEQHQHVHHREPAAFAL